MGCKHSGPQLLGAPEEDDKPMGRDGISHLTFLALVSSSVNGVVMRIYG
jgi:hypothetical protein